MTSTEWKTRQGSCRCGRLRFEITSPPLVTAACHCKGCQRMSASAFSLSVAVPGGGFRLLSGEPVIGGAQDMEGLIHSFCGHCMSWVFTRFPDVMGDVVNVRSTMLEDTAGLEPFIETCTAEKLDWVTTPAKHSFAHFPSPEEFPALIDEFSRR
ncbi:GFA family protein [Afifella aestuarii]|uniref:GFA family protein n=1 Tax=Afifella aestuarii TaxID=1909496 RepID=UPI000FE2D92F|nr:GFA family protein [Afifella aestuarii]